MTRILALVLAAFIPLSAVAAEGTPDETEALVQPVGETELSEFLWRKRPIMVFADTPADPRFIDQIAMLEAEAGRLLERDVVVLTDTDPAARSAVRRKLRPRGFQFVLIAKDGTVALRKPGPLSVREITRTIDKMPMRQREVEERRAPSVRD